VKALQHKIPDAAREAYLKGVELHREGDLDRALTEYGRALRSYPKYLEALTDIGTIFLLYNRPQSALSFLRRAQEIDDRNPVVNVNIAVAHAEQGEYDEAMKLLKKVLQLEPRTASAQFLLGKIFYLQKKYEPAETYTRQALENDPARLDAWLLIVNINLEQRRYTEAREGLERIRDAVSDQMVRSFIDLKLSELGRSHQAHSASPVSER
jgi:superkiller protein 3